MFDLEAILNEETIEYNFTTIEPMDNVWSMAYFLEREDLFDRVTLDDDTYVEIDGGYVRYNDKLVKKEALKEWHGELFAASADSTGQINTNFGTKFPRIAKVGDLFVRIDMTPNKVFKFDGAGWIEVNKENTDTYLFDERYIQYLISKIETGEYDIELLSDQERYQIEEYLSRQ